MGRRVLRLHIWGYSVCLCPINGMPGLNELKTVTQKHGIQEDLLTLFCDFNIPVNSFSVMHGWKQLLPSCISGSFMGC